ncbi:MAG: aminotransferase [Hyphomicrobiaceae bacterium]
MTAKAVKQEKYSHRQPSFNPAVADLTAPPIPLVQGWAGTYAGQHGPLIDLSQAVPGYPPHPDLLANLAQCAADPGLAGYGDIEGEANLREAFAAYTSLELGADIKSENIQITAGCNQAFVIAMLVAAAAGDRVLLTNPCFFNHEAALKMIGLEPRFVDCRAADGFVPDAAAIAQAIDRDGIRVVALVTPNNPTGAAYPDACLHDIQAVCAERGVWLVIDETYADFLPSGTAPRHQLLNTPGWEKNTILLYSFSKTYCIPGHRVGAITAGADVIVQATKVMDNLQICAPRHAQAALADALTGLTRWRHANTTEIARRADAFRSALADVPAWKITALGAYFAYVQHPFDDRSSMTVAENLAREAGIVCLPGTFFGDGQESFLRMAFANVDADQIARIPARFDTFCGPDSNRNLPAPPSA